MIPVTISEEAMVFINEKISDTGSKDLIVFFEGFGWGGPKFGIDTASKILETDEKIYDEDFRIFIDKMARQVLNEVYIIVKKSVFSGKYLAVKGAGGCC